MSHRIRSALVGLACLAPMATISLASAEEALSGDTARPACGPAAVVSWLAIRGEDARVSDVERAFQRVGVADVRGAVSAADIRAALKTLAIETELLRWPVHRYARAWIPVPAIVHFSAAQAGQPGHFVTFVKRADGRVWLHDLSADEPLREMSQAEFMEAWDGVAIYPTGTWVKTGAWPALLVVGGLASCLIAIRLWRGWKRRRSRSGVSLDGPVMTTCLLASVSAMGCGRAVTTEVPSPPPIRFTSPSHNLGEVRETGERIVSFPFEVIANSPGKITEVVPCCGGRLVETDLIGIELAAGSKHSLKLAWGVSDDPFPRSMFARIVTDPPSSSPLAVAVHFQFVGPPRLSKMRLSFDASTSSGGGAMLDAFRWRPTGAAPLTLLQDQSRSAHVMVQEANQTTEIVKRDGGRMALDSTRIRLAAKGGLSPGTLRETLPLVWSDGTRQNVELTIQVVPPVRAEPESLFFGYLSPGEIKEVAVTLHETGVSVFEVVRAELKDRSISTEYDAGGHRLRARIVAPSTAGRVQSEIRITFRPPTIPELTIPVSAIIRGEQHGRAASGK